MGSWKKVFGLSIVLALLVVFCPPAGVMGQQGDTAPPENEPVKTSDWNFVVSAYGWMTAINGTAAIDGHEVDIDVPFEDILNNMDGFFECYLEAGWREWYAAFDGTWLILGGDIDTRLVDAGIKFEEDIYDIRAGYHFYMRDLTEADESGKADWKRSAVGGVFVGARYWDTAITVADTTLTGKTGSTTVESDRWDAFIGVDGAWDFTRRWNLSGRGDIGGFGIGSSSRFAWRLNAEIGFRFLHYLTAGLGYRVMSYNTIEGEGEEENGMDLTLHGPIIALAVRF